MSDQQSLYIGIDIGTSGIRAIAIDNTTTVQAQAAVALPAPRRQDNHIEQDPALWWQAVRDCLAKLTTHINPQEVTALCVDGTSATLLITDADGQVLYPALMYNDTRAQDQATQLAATLPADTAAHGAASTLSKLLWLKQHHRLPDDAKLFHQADWIAARLRGDQRALTDMNNAMKLGYDAQHHRWPAWLQNLLTSHGISIQLLPEVLPPGTPSGNLSHAIARELGLTANTQIIAGTTDSTAAFMATGASEVGEAVTSLGSTLVIKLIADKPVFDASYGIYSQPLMLNGVLHWLVGGASNSGGAVLRQYFNDKQIQTLTPQLQPDQPTGLDYYPLPAPGERFPVSDSMLAPRLDPRPKDDATFLQGMLEGIARIEAQAYRLLESLGTPKPISIRTTGGGAVNPAWTRIRELYTGIPMQQASSTEAAYGSALLARQGMQVY